MSTLGQQSAVDDVELDAVVSRIWAGRAWVLASVIIFAVGGSLASMLMTPVFRAATVLVDATADRGGLGGMSAAIGQLGGLASLAGINLGSGASQVEESIAVLQSRELTEQLIVDQNLLPKFFANDWDADSGKFKGDEADWPTLADAYDYFHNDIRSVTRDRLSGLITVAIEWRDPVEAAEWANILVARVNEEMRGRAIASSTASLGYLEKELATTAMIETRQAINRLMEAQINQRMVANVTLEYAFRVVDRAMPPDARKPIRPQKLNILLLAVLLGFLVGVILALGRGVVGKRRKSVGPRAA